MANEAGSVELPKPKINKPFVKPDAIPKENLLPFKVNDSSPSARQGRDTKRWDMSLERVNGAGENVTLKAVRAAFSSGEAARRKKDYEFLISEPEFKKFVPETSFFKAASVDPDNQKDPKPETFFLQKNIVGRNIDQIPDNELYRDPVVMTQLVEFIDATVKVFKKAGDKNHHVPDLYGENLLANLTHNPRHTSNIVIADQPDKNGQQVFFVDVAPNVQASKGLPKFVQDKVRSGLQVHKLQAWKSTIQEKLGTSARPSENKG